MKLQGGFLEIKVEFVTSTRDVLYKPKKEVPHSRIRQNWQRLAKFLQKTEPERPLEAHEETSNGVTDNTNVSDMPLEALRGSPYASGASVGKGANRDQELGTFLKDKPQITPPPQLHQKRYA